MVGVRRLFVGIALAGAFVLAQVAYKTSADLVAEARKVVKEVAAQDAYKAFVEGKGRVVIVDVREIDELQRDGKAQGAIHIPRGRLEFEIERLYPDRKSVLIYVYCARSGRAVLACKTLAEMGYQAFSVQNGFSAWVSANLPTEKVK